jgi:ABC-type sugar transport system permease subunit
VRSAQVPVRPVAGPRVSRPATGRGRAGPRVSGPAARRGRAWWPYLFVLPAVAALGFGFVLPLVTVIRNSLYSGSIYQLEWAGLGNFSALFADDTFRTALANNLRLLLTVPLMTVLALLVAVVLNDGVRGWRVYRTVTFLPYILPAVGIGVSFSVFLQLNGGLNASLTVWRRTGWAARTGRSGRWPGWWSGNSSVSASCCSSPRCSRCRTR